MKRLIVIICLIIPFLLGHAQQQDQSVQRGMKPVQMTIDGTTSTLYKQSHALLIGVSAYNYGLPVLPGVTGDINSVKSLLQNMGFSTTIIMNPNALELQKAFSDFIARYGQGIDNRLLIYFAGHGYTEKMPYGDDIGYICPVDAPDPHKDPASFQTKAMPMRTIETYAYQIKSKHALFVFDACFSGSIFSTSRAIPEAINYKTKEPVRQFISSGSANETVPDKSIFCSQMERGLKGEADLNRDGFITGSELGDFLQTSVVNYTNNYQHPQYGKIRNPNLDKGDFVFVLAKKAQMNTGPDNTGPIAAPKETIIEKSLVGYGSLEITTGISGKLYVDEVYKKDVNANSLISINNLEEGTHKILIRGDEQSEHSVTVFPDQVAKLKIDSKNVNSARPNSPKKTKKESVLLADAVFSTENGGKCQRNYPTLLDVLVQNLGRSMSEELIVEFSFPNQNCVFFSESDKFNIGKLKPDESKVIEFIFTPTKRYTFSFVPVKTRITGVNGQVYCDTTLQFTFEENLPSRRTAVSKLTPMQLDLP